jgi:hypothetical protein
VFSTFFTKHFAAVVIRYLILASGYWILDRMRIEQ